jgi:bacteriorhodopsin
MLNLILGILTGIGAASLYFNASSQAWYVWVMFIIGAAAIIFACDVLVGSIKEHEKRAAALGFPMFAVPGLVLVVVSLILGF